MRPKDTQTASRLVLTTSVSWLALAAACGQWSGTGDGGVDAGSQNTSLGTPTGRPLPGANGGGNQASGTPGDSNVGDANVVTTTPDQAGTADQPNARTLQFLGRMDDDSLLFTWPGNAVQATFTGTKGSASFRTASGTNFVGVSVDGGTYERVAISGSASVNFGPVPQGTHTVRIAKLNESNQGSFSFRGLATDGTLVPSTPSARRLEFVGASMTLGYGVDGTPPCSNGPDKENVTAAYSWLAAQALEADISVVAFAGYGLVRNTSGASNAVLLPDIYRRTTAGDGAKLWNFPPEQEPDAVVVNVGTNDFANDGRGALDQNAFRAAYTAFATTLRGLHPRAAIVLTSSPMLTDNTSEKQHSSLLSAIKAVKQNTADPNLFVLDFPVQSGPSACDSHPSRAQHQAMGALLVTELKRDLGW